MSKVHLHASLQRFADNYETIEIPGNCTLMELINRLVTEFPGLKPIIFSNENQISPYLVIFINGQDWRHLNQDYIVASDANIEIITSLVGG